MLTDTPEQARTYLNLFLDKNHPTMRGIFYTGKIKTDIGDCSAYDARTIGALTIWAGHRLPGAAKKIDLDITAESEALEILLRSTSEKMLPSIMQGEGRKIFERMVSAYQTHIKNIN